MEPISLREAEDHDDNLRSHSSMFGKFTDTDLDKLQLGLTELEKVMSAFPGASEGGNSTNFIEFFPENNSDNHTLPPQPQCHFTTRQILDDFDEFETKMLLPTPTSRLCSQQGINDTVANYSSNSGRITATITINNSNNNEQQNLAREIEESQVMIEEMADGDDRHHQGSSSTFVLEHSIDITENLNIDIEFDDDFACYNDIAGGSGIGPFYEQACGYVCRGGSSNGLGLEGDYFQGTPGTRFFGGHSPSVRYFTCSRNSNGCASEQVSGLRKKRRYKGVVETEEETVRRVERTKIKNREAAAKAHQRKQAHEANLQTLLPKLRKKNRFLKTMVMFLQGHKRADVRPQPLRRTISGPI